MTLDPRMQNKSLFKRFRYHFSEMGVVFLFLMVPTLLMFLETRLSIEVTLMKRKIQKLAGQKEALIKKNNALKGANATFSGASRIERIFKEKYGEAPRLDQNQIVRIRLPKNISSLSPD